MRLLALDPSSVALGWACFYNGKLVDAGVRKASGTFARKMQKMRDHVSFLIDDIKPTQIAIEMHEGFPFVLNNRKKKAKRSPKVTATLCHAQGVIFGEILRLDVPVDIVGDLTWTNKRKKEDRAKAVHKAYPDFQFVWAHDKGLDAADATGIGLFWLDHEKTRDLLSRAGKVLKTKIPAKHSPIPEAKRDDD